MSDYAYREALSLFPAVVPEFQPLAADAIWRVALAGGSVGYLVRRDEQDYASGAAGWLPLQLDDLTDAQIAIIVGTTRSVA